MGEARTVVVPRLPSKVELGAHATVTALVVVGSVLANARAQAA